MFGYGVGSHEAMVLEGSILFLVYGSFVVLKNGLAISRSRSINYTVSFGQHIQVHNSIHTSWTSCPMGEALISKCFALCRANCGGLTPPWSVCFDLHAGFMGLGLMGNGFGWFGF